MHQRLLLAQGWAEQAHSGQFGWCWALVAAAPWDGHNLGLAGWGRSMLTNPMGINPAPWCWACRAPGHADKQKKTHTAKQHETRQKLL